MTSIPKEGNKIVTLREQIIFDAVTGLTIDIRATEIGGAEICVYGENIPFGNREFAFDETGIKYASGTATMPCPLPNY